MVNLASGDAFRHPSNFKPILLYHIISILFDLCNYTETSTIDAVELPFVLHFVRFQFMGLVRLGRTAQFQETLDVHDTFGDSDVKCKMVQSGSTCFVQIICFRDLQ